MNNVGTLYFPSQASIVSVFTDHSIFSPFVGSIAYGALLLIAALLIYWRRMRIVRPR